MPNKKKEKIERLLFRQKKSKTYYYLMGQKIYKSYQDFIFILKTSDLTKV